MFLRIEDSFAIEEVKRVTWNFAILVSMVEILYQDLAILVSPVVWFLQRLGRVFAKSGV